MKESKYIVDNDIAFLPANTIKQARRIARDMKLDYPDTTVYIMQDNGPEMGMEVVEQL